MEDYDCVLDYTRGEKKHPVDQEVMIRLRNPDTMETIRARAIIRPSFEKYPGADRLYYVSATGGREKEPIAVEILETMSDEDEEVQSLPRQKLTLGQRKGRMLAEMIKEREEKKK